VVGGNERLEEDDDRTVEATGLRWTQHGEEGLSSGGDTPYARKSTPLTCQDLFQQARSFLRLDERERSRHWNAGDTDVRQRPEDNDPLEITPERGQGRSHDAGAGSRLSTRSSLPCQGYNRVSGHHSTPAQKDSRMTALWPG
jgi:hypothetical protein